MARVMLAHFGDAANVRGCWNPSNQHQPPTGNGSPCGGYWKPSGSVGTLGGDQTSTNHGQPFRAMLEHRPAPRGNFGMLARLAGSNQPTSTNHGGNVSPLCNVSPLFRIRKTHHYQPRGNLRGMLPTFGRSNQRSVPTGQSFGAILAHSPHVVGCIY